MIRKNAIFDVNEIAKVMTLAQEMRPKLASVLPRPFLNDASERNVIVHKGKISGIVDVDDLGFGDSLFVLALTSVALEMEGFDSVYTDHWAELLNMDNNARHRLAFYQLFYTVDFMRKHGMNSPNQQKITYNAAKLLNMFETSCHKLSVRQ